VEPGSDRDHFDCNRSSSTHDAELRRRHPVFTDGPFLESNEFLASFWVIQIKGTSQ
jgi:hypothetical protein